MSYTYAAGALRRSWLVFIVLPVVFGPALLCHSPIRMGSKPVRFHSIEEIMQFAEGNAFSVFRYADNPLTRYRCYISDHSLSPLDVKRLNAVDCDRNPHWRGIIFVTEYGSLTEYPEVVYPDSFPNYRFWGKLMVAGDESLMDRIEKIYRLETSGDTNHVDRD